MVDRRSRLRRPRHPWLAVGLLAGVAVVGIIVAVAAGAFSTNHKKVVKVVVSSPKPEPTASTTTATSSGGSSGGSPSSSGSSSSAVLRAGARTSFAQFAVGLPGHVDVALAPLSDDRVVVLGSDTPAHGWSTTKIPVLVALLLARQDSGGLTPTEQGWAQLAITESDNQSILNLFGDLESLEGGLLGASQYVQQLFRESGDDQTVVATAPPPPGAVTTFGQTEWAPGQAVRFFRALADGCLIEPSQTSYVLGLMQRIVPSESWGLGEASFGVPVAFKGGWGPEQSGYLVRQSGIIDPGSPRGVAVSIVAYPPAGGDSFGVGTQMVTQTAQWLAHEVVLQDAGGRLC